jgi:hypothetical protein
MMADLTSTKYPQPLGKIIRAKQVAIPSEHGAWIFLFSPMLIGIAIGGFSRGSFPLIVALVSAFMIRQPLTILVKILSKRRPKSDLPSALFWFTCYLLILFAAVEVLFTLGYKYIFYLVLPAFPIFAWHLWLVSKRAERRKILIEIAASGVLSLAAPASFWIGQNQYSSFGWLLWLLCWLQVTGTILYAYLRLEQRKIKEKPSTVELFRLSKRPLIFNTVIFIIVILLSIMKWVPGLLPIAFMIQPIEIIWGTIHPAISTSPKKIGIRQLIISILFTFVFIGTWVIS